MLVRAVTAQHLLAAPWRLILAMIGSWMFWIDSRAYTRFAMRAGRHILLLSLLMSMVGVREAHASFTDDPGGAGFHRQLNAIACSSSRSCVTLGAHGAILQTLDGGKQWLVRVSGTVRELNGVACSSRFLCLAVGNKGTILRSVDGGMTWRSSPRTTARSLFSVACPSIGLCFAVGEHGAILVSRTHGQNWSVTAGPTKLALDDITCPTVTWCYAVGEQAIILVSSDGGIHWRAQYQGDWEMGLAGVSCPAVTHCVAVGNGREQSQILYTLGAGEWRDPGDQDPQIYMGEALTAVVCPTTSECVATGYGGELYRSDSGGRRWYLQTSPGADLLGITCVPDHRCFVVGARGTILSVRW